LFQLDHGWASEELDRPEELTVWHADGNTTDAIHQRSPNQLADEKLRQNPTRCLNLGQTVGIDRNQTFSKQHRVWLILQSSWRCSRPQS
jgi:hypothetical protein